MTKFEKWLIFTALVIWAITAVMMVSAVRQMRDRLDSMEAAEPHVVVVVNREAPVTMSAEPQAEEPLAEESMPKNREVFTAYAYCSCYKCCGQWAEIWLTASGTKPQAGRTIAVDPDVIPLGTTVWVDGVEMVAEDTGSGIWGNTIDIYHDTHEAALEWGKREVVVEW